MTTKCCWKLHNEESNFYSSPAIIGVIKSGRTRRVGRVAYVGRLMYTKFQLENLRGRKYMEDLVRRTISKENREIDCKTVH
jgi:hypothetical protein